MHELTEKIKEMELILNKPYSEEELEFPEMNDQKVREYLVSLKEAMKEFYAQKSLEEKFNV